MGEYIAQRETPSNQDSARRLPSQAASLAPDRGAAGLFDGDRIHLIGRFPNHTRRAEGFELRP